jgi:MarR family transcriptional regulator, 2-MHQ and catechol-resistance regulon repressor
MNNRALRTIRRLATAYHAFAAYSAAQVRALDLTPPQFDVIATLGNQPGMTCRELGERTLITKGTLTGVLDRMESRGLLTREPLPQDRRSVFVRLTPAGEQLFARVFPPHARQVAQRMRGLDAAELDQLDDLLERVAAGFDPAADPHGESAPSPKTRMIAASRRAP